MICKMRMIFGFVSSKKQTDDACTVDPAPPPAVMITLLTAVFRVIFDRFLGTLLAEYQGCWILISLSAFGEQSKCTNLLLGTMKF